MRALAHFLFLISVTLATLARAEQIVAKAEGPGIVEAYFSEDADVYPHRVLGDVREKLSLSARDHEGRLHRVQLYLLGDRINVFEDIAPRLADVDGDGLADIIVVETDPRVGASLAVYGLRGGRIEKVAATPHIGTAYRWLAPAGVADFNGDGVKDVAYVETPHIGGILRIWSFKDGQARELASEPGYSNHRIGENFVTGGVRDCGRGPELVLPDAGWRRSRIAWLHAGAIESASLADNTRPETIASALECP